MIVAAVVFVAESANNCKGAHHLAPKSYHIQLHSQNATHSITELLLMCD
jgi:hypothetical protein